jgi:hypothetical protein
MMEIIGAIFSFLLGKMQAQELSDILLNAMNADQVALADKAYSILAAWADGYSTEWQMRQRLGGLINYADTGNCQFCYVTDTVILGQN